MKEILFLKPVFKEKVWGGGALAPLYGYPIPSDHTGECWAIAAHPNGDCLVREGRFEGKRLSELWRDHRELFGGLPGDRFPLLIKIIDAREDLSIQVHPDDAYARIHENGSLGKKECWYILDCDPGTTIIIGQKARSREEFEQRMKSGQWKDLLNEIPIHPGDFFQIDPGTVHAIKGGTILLETQQNSDVTYRVYDYDRMDHGRKRPLHIRQSLDVIRFDERKGA